MDTVAFVVVGERGHRSVHLDQTIASQTAVRCHGVVKDLVLAEDVRAAIRAAYEQGMRDARRESSNA